ncbi:MAG TPA: DUF4239 domain-containing protein [Myxococcales bacterium]|jgi:hypothetical protein
MRIIVRAVLAAMLAAAVARVVHLASPFDLHEATKSLSAFLHVYGAIYGTLLAFLIFVVWGQFVAAEAGVAREAKALQELAALCRAGRRDGCEEVLQPIREYARIAVGSEWKGLAEGKPTPAADQAFLAIQTAVLRSSASTEAEELARATIIRVAERAAALRAERVAVSITRIPPTLWATLVFASGLLCFSIGLLDAEPLASTYMTAGMTLVVVLLLGVIADMDNPFDGTFNASRVPMEALKHL